MNNNEIKEMKKELNKLMEISILFDRETLNKKTIEITNKYNFGGIIHRHFHNGRLVSIEIL